MRSRPRPTHRRRPATSTEVTGRFPLRHNRARAGLSLSDRRFDSNSPARAGFVGRASGLLGARPAVPGGVASGDEGRGHHQVRPTRGRPGRRRRPGARGRPRRPARSGARDHGQPHRLRLPSGVPVLHPRRLRLARAEGARVGHRVRRRRRAGRPAGDPLRPRRPGLRLRRGAVRYPRRARRRGRVLLRRTGARRGRPPPRCRGDRGQPLRPEQHPPCRCRAEPPGARARRHRRDRVCCRAAARRPGGRRHRHRPHGARRAGARAGCPARRRLRGRGLHRHRRDRRRGARHGRQEHLRGLPCGSSARRASTCRPISGRTRRTSPCRW